MTLCVAAAAAGCTEILTRETPLRDDLRLHRCVVVVHDVVGAQQHIAFAAG